MALIDELKGLTNEGEIAKLLTPEVYETLTANDPQIVRDALSRASAYLSALLLSCGIERVYLKDRGILKLILEKLTLYEIAMYADVELSFKNEKDEALELLKGYFGCDKNRRQVRGSVVRDPRVKEIRGYDVG